MARVITQPTLAQHALHSAPAAQGTKGAKPVATAKPAPAKQSYAAHGDGRHEHAHHPHPHPPRRHPAHRPGHPGLVTALVAAALTLAAGGWYLMSEESPVQNGGAPQLILEMRAVAAGANTPYHVFGGPLSVNMSNGRINVTAANIPPKACVQAGWKLSKEGTVIVNGILSARLSAARLSEMCNLREDGTATVTWAPAITGGN